MVAGDHPVEASAMRAFPSSSKLSGRLAEAYYHDSYDAPLARPELTMLEIYAALLAQLPWWARVLLIMRNAIVSPFGLRTEPAADVWKPKIRDNYRPGDKFVRFRLYDQDEEEIVAGADDKHLDFRVSVLRAREQDVEKVILSTVIFTHNVFGRLYLFFVLPFHRFGLRRLMARAVAQGRI
jgi:hypothetical protein